MRFLPSGATALLCTMVLDQACWSLQRRLVAVCLLTMRTPLALASRPDRADKLDHILNHYNMFGESCGAVHFASARIELVAGNAAEQTPTAIETRRWPNLPLSSRGIIVG